MTYNEILEKFSFENVLKMYSSIPYVFKKEIPHITAYPNLVLETAGMISNSDRKLQAVVLKTAEIILTYFSDELFDGEDKTINDLYDATIYGLYKFPKHCKHFKIDVFNNWIDCVEVYFAIDGTFEDDNVYLGDNTTQFILIDPDNSGQRVNPTKFNSDKSRLEYGSIFIRYSEVIKYITINNKQSLDDFSIDEKDYNLKKVQGIIMHEIAHIYYMWKRGIQQKDIVYDTTTFSSTIPSIYNSINFYNGKNILNIISSINLNNQNDLDYYVSLMNVNEIVHFLNDASSWGIIYMLNKSEITSRLETLKKEMSYKNIKRIINQYNTEKNNHFYTLENAIVDNSVTYQQYMMICKLVRTMRKNVSILIKQEFNNNFGNVMSDIYKISKNNTFDNLMDLFIERCHYFMHNAGTYISEHVHKIINYKENKTSNFSKMRNTTKQLNNKKLLESAMRNIQRALKKTLNEYTIMGVEVDSPIQGKMSDITDLDLDVPYKDRNITDSVQKIYDDMFKNYKFNYFLKQNGMTNEIQWSYKIQTACTDGFDGQLIMNPEFAQKIYDNAGELAIQFIILHETMHNYYNNVRHAMKVTSVATNIMVDRMINNEIIRRWSEFKDVPDLIGALL